MDLIERVRHDLAAVDDAPLASTDRLLGAARRIERRRHDVRRRAVAGGAAVVLVAVAGIALVASRGHEPVVRGMDIRPVTSPVPPTTGAVTVPATSAATTVAVTTSTIAVVGTQPDTVAPDGPGSQRWEVVPPEPARSATNPMGVWDGHEVISFGGVDSLGHAVVGASAYDPSAERWRTIADPPVGKATTDAIVVWTGDEVLVVGGRLADGTEVATAAAYIPGTQRWRSITSWGNGSIRASDPWVWTGSQLLVWPGGNVTGADQPSPLAFDPVDDTWTQLAAPSGVWRDRAASVWTGREWLVWGGQDVAGDAHADGIAYDPSTGTWRTIAPSPLSPRRVEGAWTGSELIVVAGSVGGDPTDGNGAMALSDGAAYDPQADTWRPITNAGIAHPGFVPVWTGTELLMFAKGGVVIYDPAADRWDESCCNEHLAVGAAGQVVWTGEMVVLLGTYDGSSGGWVFRPSAPRSG